MDRTITEQKLLKKFGIENFRQMTKENAIELFSMLDRVDPEVAIKALEQFPAFAESAKEAVINYKEIIIEGLQSNKLSVEEQYKACNALLDVINKELEKDSLSCEERCILIDKMREVVLMMKEIDESNKEFIKGIVRDGLIGLVTITAALVTVLGVNVKIPKADVK